MPVGGSTPTGAYGYIRAYAELILQCEQRDIEPAAIVFANGSGGTQAGLIAGSVLLGGGPRIAGVAVAIEPDLMTPLSDGLADAALAQLGEAVARRDPATVLDGYRGPKYGEPTAEGEKALSMMLRHEAILLDPVYTAKAFSAIIAKDAAIPEGPIVFLHTGGTPAFFATTH